MFTKAWEWISSAENRDLVTFFGGGLVIVISAAWAVYVHRSKRAISPQSIQVSAAGRGIATFGDISASASSGSVAT